MLRLPPGRSLAAAALLIGGLAAAAVAPAAPARPTHDESLEPQIRRLTDYVAASYDSVRGGFVTRDRAPNEASIELAWRLAAEGDAAWRRRARRSVEWTWTLYDSTGGGFLQGERDARRDMATFEKRTDSNALRLENRIDAWLDAKALGAEGNADAETDRRVIRQALDFFERVLLDARGGFVAGQVGDRELVPESNGPAIGAYLRWAAATGEPRWRDFAWKSLDRIFGENWNPDFGFLRLGAMGQVISVPRLDDQVEMGRAFVLAAHVGGREADLQRARAIGDLLLARFEDRKLGGMRGQVALGRDGKIKGAARDPEPNARAARFLAELASVTGDGKYRDAARRLVDQFVPGRNRGAADDADWVLAMRSMQRAELPGRAEWKAPPPPTPQVSPVFRVKKRGK